MKILAVLGVFFTAMPALAQDETAGFRVREWYAKLNGDIKVQTDSVALPATTIDIDSELGLGSAEFAHEIQGYLAVPVLGKFYAGAWFTRLEGDKTLGRDINFEDETFFASTRVKTELDLDVYYLTYEFSFSPPTGDFIDLEVGLQAGVRGILAEGAISESTFGLSESDTGFGVLPVIGVHGAVSFTEWLRADVEVVGLTFKQGSSKATYLEAYAEIVAQLGPVFGGVGYKYVLIEIGDNRGSVDFDLDVVLDGIYLTAGVRF